MSKQKRKSPIRDRRKKRGEDFLKTSKKATDRLLFLNRKIEAGTASPKERIEAESLEHQLSMYLETNKKQAGKKIREALRLRTCS